MPTQRATKTVVFVACAVLLTGLAGCRGGLRSLTGPVANVDPFLDDNDDSRFSEDLDEFPEQLADRSASALNRLNESQQQRIQRAQQDVEQVIDASLFEDLPTDVDDAVKSGNEIAQAAFSQDAPLVPPDPIGPADQQSASVNSGLGAASPWGNQNRETSALDVALSFEEDDSQDARSGSDDFPIQLEEFETGDSRSLPVPDGSDSERARSGSRWSRFNIFGKPSDTEESATSNDEKGSTKKPGRSIRDRFSKLGARFGLTDDDEKQSPDAIKVMTDPRGNSADCIEDLITRTQSKVENVRYNQLGPAEREAFLRNHVNLRLFYLANNQNERALDAIPGIPPAEQEFWQQMFWSLSQYRNSDAVPDRTERITQTVSQLRTALQRLQETANLQLRNVSFCRRISGFGNYERFEKDVFKPGDPVLVYAEIENFRSEPTASGQYRTILRSVLQIVPEAGGESVDSVTLRPVEDVCRSPRRDYFNSYEFTIPNNIKPGRYILDISVSDRLSGKSATQSVAFTVK